MKKVLSLLFKLTITLLLFFLLFRNLGFSNVMGRILSADPVWCMAAAALFLLSMVLSAVQWDLLLCRQEICLGFRNTFNLYMIGHFFNNFLPGAMGGDLIKVYRLRQDLRRGKEGLAAVFLDRFAGLFMLALFALLSSLYLHFLSKIEIEGHVYLYIGGLFGLFFFQIIILFSRRVATFIYEVLLKNINPFELRDKVKDLHNFLHLYRGSRRLYLQVFLLSASIQFMRITVHFLVARAVGFDVPFVYFLVFVPLIALVASLPISFGGLGVREGLGQVLFATVTPNATLAVAAQFLASLVGIAVSLVGGVFFVLQKRENP